MICIIFVKLKTENGSDSPEDLIRVYTESQKVMPPLWKLSLSSCWMMQAVLASFCTRCGPNLKLKEVAWSPLAVFLTCIIFCFIWMPCLCFHVRGKIVEMFEMQSQAHILIPLCSYTNKCLLTYGEDQVLYAEWEKNTEPQNSIFYAFYA